MSASGFGYSAGDFVVTLQLIAKVITAFKESGGASDEYRQLLDELETLLRLLQQLDAIQSTEANRTHVNGIKAVASGCRKPLQEFLDKTSRRYGSLLGGGQKQRGIATAVRKVQWAVFMDKNIIKLRGMIQANVINIDLLLGTSQL